MKRILITGGSGFIGTNLIQKLLLEEKHIFIYCVDNFITGNRFLFESFPKDKFRLVEMDICSPDFLSFDFGSIDQIYHLAGIASPEKYMKYPLMTLDTSILGTKNVLELTRIHHCRMLFTSTSEVYGDPLVHPQPEEYYGNVNTLGDRSCYDEGKRVAETYIYEYKKKFHLHVKIVRIFNTYGPHMDIEDGRVITNFFKNIFQKKPIVIYGDGTQTRSFCYVSDMVEGLISMMNSEEFGPINLGNPFCELSLLELVQCFEKVVNHPIPLEFMEKKMNDPQCRKPVIQKAKKALGWHPKVDILDGLEATYEFFLS